MIKYLLFDAANTLIHKPKVYENVQTILSSRGILIDLNTIRFHHKLVSEVMIFPDRTNSSFFKEFNTNWLNSLGVISNNKLLNEVFESCSYLPWEVFPDVNLLKKNSIPIGVLSNFNSDLKEILSGLFGKKFYSIITSEQQKLRKPDVKFFEIALKQINLKPEEILYVGDSIKLDIEPALKLGFQTKLIDRHQYYPHYSNRISSFLEINNLIN